MSRLQTEDRTRLSRIFFTKVPKARPSDPFFQSIFNFMYEARERVGTGSLLNIYMSGDMSGEREEVYRTYFFDKADITSIDFQEDTFVFNEERQDPRHTLPFPDNSFDVIVTTKYILEHVTEPGDVFKELRRVLKPGGEAFLVAAHVRRQHQRPFDFYRYTEDILAYLAKNAGFTSWDIRPTDSGFYTLSMYSYFIQRSLSMPKFLEQFLDFVFQHITTSFFFFLHRHDNGYGRDLSSYFTIRAKK